MSELEIYPTFRLDVILLFCILDKSILKVIDFGFLNYV